MEPLKVFDRYTKSIVEEPVYGETALSILYGDSFFSKTIGAFLLFFVARFSFISALYGKLQKLPFSKRKIVPFITKFHIHAKEFENSIDEFSSFNDFFIRKLHVNARPLADTPAILPADARYTIVPKISEAKFLVKGRAFNLEEFLCDKALAELFSNGSMVVARLCPLDYHRFHFPCDGIAKTPKEINGYLYSVNPIALHHNWKILSENRRILTLIETKSFGTIAFIEVGATCVGEIYQTYKPENPVQKGDEKGYFSFGGSTIVLLFQQNTITFSEDLLNGPEGIEIVGKMGQRLGS